MGEGIRKETRKKKGVVGGWIVTGNSFDVVMGNGPSKHAGSHPEVFWLWPVMAIMASLQPELGWIVYAGSDFLDCFQFWFSKEGMGHTVQN